MKHIPYRNPSGCPDPTAHDALTAVAKVEDEAEQRMSRMVKSIKALIDLCGFDLLVRIEVRDRRTGRVFR